MSPGRHALQLFIPWAAGDEPPELSAKLFHQLTAWLEPMLAKNVMSNTLHVSDTANSTFKVVFVVGPASFRYLKQSFDTVLQCDHELGGDQVRLFGCQYCLVNISLVQRRARHEGTGSTVDRITVLRH